MSNESRITTNLFFFYKLRWTPKFTNNQWITDTDICIFVRIFVHICIHTFCRCYAQFGVQPNHIQIKMFAKTTYKCFWRKRKVKEETKKKQRIWGLMLGLAYLMPDCWLEVSLQSEDLVTGQLDQDFLSLVSEQNLGWYPNSTLYCMLHMRPSQWYH
jgi:hypothetical protein